jgi:hypothetical protein
MIKATIPGKDGRTALYVGLSFGNLDRFRQQPLDTFIKIDGKEMGLPMDVVLFSGRTEAEMAELLAGGIGPDTKVHISDKLKS